jgi:hypothetical protein
MLSVASSPCELCFLYPDVIFVSLLETIGFKYTRHTFLFASKFPPYPHFRILIALSDIKEQAMLFAFESFPSAVVAKANGPKRKQTSSRRSKKMAEWGRGDRTKKSFLFPCAEWPKT